MITVGPPSAPSVISIMQISDHNTTLLISWSASDCAVQYEVTIFTANFYGEITKAAIVSATNTTRVTLIASDEFCATVLGIDSSGRRGPASLPLCSTNKSEHHQNDSLCHTALFNYNFHRRNK